MKIFNMYRFISKRFTNQELIWQLTDNMQSGGSCSVCKRRKSTSLLQIIYHWSNLIACFRCLLWHKPLSQLRPFNILFDMSENYKRILTFKRGQGGSFQFRLLSVIIETSVKVRAFLDFCLCFKHFNGINMKVRV